MPPSARARCWMLAACAVPLAAGLARAEGFDASPARDLISAVRGLGGRIGRGSAEMARRSNGSAERRDTAPPPAFVLPGLKGDTLVLASPEETRKIAEANLARPAAQRGRLKILTGKVVLILFWTPWSKPSVDALAEVNAHFARFSPRGFEAVAIAVDAKGEAVLDVAAPADSTGKRIWKYAYDFAVDDGYASAPYGIGAYPHFVIVDRSGRAVSSEPGAGFHGLHQALSKLLP